MEFLKGKLLAILIAIGCVVLVTILYFSYRNTRELIDATSWIEHTQQVLLEADKLAMDVKNIQVNGRVYLITKDEKMLSAIAAAERAGEARIRRLRNMVSDNPAQVVSIDSLSDLFSRHTNLGSMAASRPDNIGLFIQSKEYEDEFLRRLGNFQEGEYGLLAIRKARSDRSVLVFKWFLLGLMIVLGSLMVLVYVSMRNSEKLRLQITEQNASLLKSLRETTDYKYALDESAIVAITDQRGIIKHVNDNFCKISKYSRDELMGQDHRIINSQYHSKEFMGNMWRTIANGKAWKGEIRNKAKDGNFYWVDTSIVPFLNDQGRPYQYLAIRWDITERRIAEDIRATNRRLGAEIQEKKAQLADVFERITDGFVTLDERFVYTHVNKKAAEMVHSKPSSMLNKNIWDLFPDLVGSPTYVAFKEALKEQHYVKAMDYYPPLDLWFENHVYPTEDGLSIFIRDVTKQMKAEQKNLETTRLYHAIAATIPGSVICVLDQDYRYILVEGDMIDKLGYSKLAVLDKKAKDVLSKERFEEMEKYFKRAFDGEIFSVEIQRTPFDLLTRYVPIRDEHGKVASIIVASIDVTPLKEAERRVAELNIGLEKKIAERTAQLESVNKDLESFSYSVAHDLRSPLRGVSGYTSMLAEDYGSKLDDEGKRLLSEINYNANRMSTLIDDLLTFSRLGRKEVRKSAVDMKALIEDVLKQLSPGKAKLRIETLHPVVGDFALLRHVVGNLLSNAIKYSAREVQPEITIASASQDGMVTYSITDNGVGFNMEHAGELFGVFKRLHTNEEFEGTGVGLAIAQKIVQRHGGKIWAHSKVNEGASFFFTLPAIPSGYNA